MYLFLYNAAVIYFEVLLDLNCSFIFHCKHCVLLLTFFIMTKHKVVLMKTPVLVELFSADTKFLV